MKRWNLIVDVEKCEDCNNCFLACKDEHVGNNWKGYTHSQPLHGHRWINIFRKERGQYPLIDVAYLPVLCMQCDNAPCVKMAKDGAFYKRDDGIVLIDEEKAVGRKDILKACPYDAIWWNEEKRIPQKCTFCAHLLDDGWKEPRCVQACPTGALCMIYEEDSKVKKIIETDGLEDYKPEYKTEPRVLYRNLYRYFSCFIGGSIATEINGKVECLKNARVILIKDSIVINEKDSDCYGDFKFDYLEQDSGTYTLEISHPDHGKKTLAVNLHTSISLGPIFL